jgi:two-component sensor histidine kinase
MPISSRFVVGSTIVLLSIGFLTLLGIIGATVWLGERAQHFFEESGRARVTRLSTVELRNALQTAESSQRGFLVGGNEIYLAPYDAAKTRVLTQFDRLKPSLNGSEKYRNIVQRLSEIIPEKIAEMDSTIQLKNDARDADALAIFRSNRGKALMDETNVFLSSIIRSIDERLEGWAAEQTRNAIWLRLVSGIGGLIIIIVVTGVMFTLFRYAREITRTRDQVDALNTTLEQRVKSRTIDLAQARDRAEVLLAEVNHRVANSLSLVASLVHLQSNAVDDVAAKQALKETEARILAISSVHKRLYNSDDTRFVDLDEYLTSLLGNVEAAMHSEGHGASLRYELEPLKMKTDWSINLGVIVTEWITNAFKYAYPNEPGEVRVRLKRLSNGRAELLVEDDGIGRISGEPAKGSGLGTRIVNAMARTIGADIEYLRTNPGTVARLVFSSSVEN